MGQNSLICTCATNTHRAHLVAYSRWDASVPPLSALPEKLSNSTLLKENNCMFFVGSNTAVGGFNYVTSQDKYLKRVGATRCPRHFVYNLWVIVDAPNRRILLHRGRLKASPRNGSQKRRQLQPEGDPQTAFEKCRTVRTSERCRAIRSSRAPGQRQARRSCATHCCQARS
jgi:hypothetical protein